MATREQREAARIDVRANWRLFLERLLTPKRGIINGEKSYICPVCNHGARPGQTGLMYNPAGKDGVGLICKNSECAWKGGDIISLYQVWKRVTYPTALNELAAMIGIDLTGQFDTVKRQIAARKEATAKLPPPPKPRPLQDFTAYYTRAAQALTEGSEAAAFFEGRGPGFTLALARAFHMGYDPKWQNPACSPGRGNGTGTPRLIIPTCPSHYIARDIRPNLTEEERRNKALNGGSPTPFNGMALYQEAGAVFIVEGWADALAIMLAGGVAVALNSADNWRRFIEGNAPQTWPGVEPSKVRAALIVALDNDTAGRAAQEELINGLKGKGMRAIAANVAGTYNDPNEALQKDAETFKKAVAEAIARAEVSTMEEQRHAQEEPQATAEATPAPSPATEGAEFAAKEEREEPGRVGWPLFLSEQWEALNKLGIGHVRPLADAFAKPNPNAQGGPGNSPLCRGRRVMVIAGQGDNGEAKAWIIANAKALKNTGAAEVKLITLAERQPRQGELERLYYEAPAINLAEPEPKRDDFKRAEEEYRIETACASSLLPALIEKFGNEAPEPMISTGYPYLDEILGGGLYASFYMLGARSSLGKTTLALQIADWIAADCTADNIEGIGEPAKEKPFQPVFFFTLEMAREELIARSASRLSYLLACQQRGNKYEGAFTRAIIDHSRWKERLDIRVIDAISKALEVYQDHIAPRMYFFEGAAEGTRIEEIRDKVSRYADKKGQAPVIFVDYLQQLAPASEKMTDIQAIDTNVRGLKQISRDFKTPLIAITSFNRAKGNEAGNMAAGRGSSSIEYTADVFLTLALKGEKEDMSAAEEGKLRAEERRKMLIKVLKNRNGQSCIDIDCDYLAKFNYFEETPGQTAKERERAKYA